ncbi:MAG: hypothetical protein OXG38_09625 [Chloroflexi bacterium]|nr:hypothetical protein [Chloroflexota bacterium]
MHVHLTKELATAEHVVTRLLGRDVSKALAELKAAGEQFFAAYELLANDPNVPKAVKDAEQGIEHLKAAIEAIK